MPNERISWDREAWRAERPALEAEYAVRWAGAKCARMEEMVTMWPPVGEERIEGRRRRVRWKAEWRFVWRVWVMEEAEREESGRGEMGEAALLMRMVGGPSCWVGC